jgi:class 3 adenylate cyclase
MSAPQDKRSRTRPAIRARAPRSTGVVTFLFTDIEGSTRLWETQGAAMRVALARHDAFLRKMDLDH